MNLLQKKNILFVSIVIFLLGIEYFTTQSMYHTLSDIDAKFYWMIFAIFLNGFAVLFWFVSKREGFAVFLIALVAVVCIPYQLYLVERYQNIRSEVMHMVHFAYDYEDTHDAYPEDLEAYVFTDATTQEHISYRLKRFNEQEEPYFFISFFIGTRSTSHWYSSKTGWGYHPD